MPSKNSGQVRPRQGTEICNFGAPSPLEALHWIFCFLSRIYVQFSKTSPLKSGESSEKSQWRKSRQILSRLWLSWLFSALINTNENKYKQSFAKVIFNRRVLTCSFCHLDLSKLSATLICQRVPAFWTQNLG